MRKIYSVLVVFALIASSFYKASAIDFVLSDTELRFSESNPSQSFTVSLDDDIEKLAGKTKTLKAKLKVNKKIFNVSTKKIEIPVVDGVTGTSSEVTITLKDPSKFSESTTQKFKLGFSKKLSKKTGVKKVKDTLYIDVGNVEISGKVTAPSAGASSVAQALAKRTRIINPLNDAGSVVIEVHAVNSDGSISDVVLATVTTNPDGTFTLKLPEGTNLGTDIVLVVPSLGYEVFPNKSEDLELNPITHFVTKEVLEKKADPNFDGTIDFGPVIETLVDQITAIGANLDDESLDELVLALEALFEVFIDNLLDNVEEGNEFCSTEEDSDLTEQELATKQVGSKDYNMTIYRSELGSSAVTNDIFDEKRALEAFEYGELELSKPDCATGMITIQPEIRGIAASELIKFKPLDNDLDTFDNDPGECHDTQGNIVPCECFDSQGNVISCEDPNAGEPKCFDSTGHEIPCEDPNHHDDDCFDAAGNKIPCEGEHVCQDTAGNEVECPDEHICQDEQGNEIECPHECVDPATGNVFPCEDGPVCHDPETGDEFPCPDEELCTDPTTGEEFPCEDGPVCHDEQGNKIECHEECLNTFEDGEHISCEDPVCHETFENDEEGPNHCEPICIDDNGIEFPCDHPGDFHHGEDSCHVLHAFNEEFRGFKGHKEPEFFASVNEFNVISLIEPSEEELEEHDVGEDLKFVGREKDSSKQLFPVGDDVFISAIFGGREEFSTEGTKLFDTSDIGFITLTQKADVNIENVSKTYGYVGISTDFGDRIDSDGRIELESTVAKLTLNAGNVSVTGTGAQIEINESTSSAADDDVESDNEEDDEDETEDCCNYTLSTDSEDFTETGTIKSEGNFIAMFLEEPDVEDADDEVPITGVANKDASILFFLTSEDRSGEEGKIVEPGDIAFKKDKIDTSSKEFAIAVELGSPSLVGNTYYVLSYDKHINDEGGLGLVTSNIIGGAPEITFNTSTSATAESMTYTDISRATCDSTLVTSSNTTLISTTPYTLASDGEFTITLNGRELTGYASADGNLIVTQAIDTTNNRQSLYVFVKKQASANAQQ